MLKGRSSPEGERAKSIVEAICLARWGKSQTVGRAGGSEGGTEECVTRQKLEPGWEAVMGTWEF